MIRTAQNLFVLTTLVALAACSKQSEITPENEESLVIDEETESEELEDDDDPPPEPPPSDEEDGSEPEPPAQEEEDVFDELDTGTAPEAAEDASSGGAYSGEITVIINTSFGPDTCSGSASVEVSEDGRLGGSGSCSFGILGAQSPVLAGTVAEDGVVTGTVELNAFGTSFSLAWTGVQDDNTLEANHNGTDSLVGVGDITYDVIINLEVEASTDGAATGPADSMDDYVDYSERGASFVYMTSGSHTSTDGCSLGYEIYTPEEAASDTLTVIQHGFARSRDEFSVMASHLASRGMPALIMDLCHSWALDVDINQNAADVVDLVESLWEGPVVYMGHSNGAMSALVAASIDDQAVAVLGLDPVERPGGDHTDIARSLSIPVAGIFGEGGACNAWNSGMDAYMAVPGSDLFRSTEADHCDFEAPTGMVCTLACGGSNDLFSDEMIRSNILGLGTAYISWHALGDEDALEWADPTGGARAVLEGEGAISGL
jgi:hypothetical protein